MMVPSKAARGELRPCRKEDIARIASIHKSQFATPGALLGHLNVRLIEGFYAAFLDRAVFLAHTSGGQVDGFVLGGSRSAIHYCRQGFFRRQSMRCIMDLIQRPQLWTRAIHSGSKLIASKISRQNIPPCDGFRLISIAVAAGATRQGIGTELVRGFEAAIRGVTDSYNLDVLKTNASAIRFYERLSFDCVDETAISWRLRKVLPPDVAAIHSPTASEAMPLAIPHDAAGQEAEKLANPTVFVVDDDPGTRDSLAWLLRQADFEVRAFATGMEFLAAFRPGTRACLLLDLRMPGMSGLDVQQELLARSARVPIVFITAYADAQSCARARRQGAIDLLEKPIDDDALLDCIGKALGSDV